MAAYLATAHSLFRPARPESSSVIDMGLNCTALHFDSKKIEFKDDFSSMPENLVRRLWTMKCFLLTTPDKSRH
jgi:hypothetical protein